mmetsp:Transcript_36022/g.90697  ORF Transcript_36022/g.90697 Transcript_36022/m.90697 type:complete len:192 (+) Transcript_36022:204-779(+)
MKHGAGELKGCVELGMHNLLPKAYVYWMFYMRHANATTELYEILLHMIRSDTYYSLPSWVVPTSGYGMPQWRAYALWKCMIDYASVTPDDIGNIFFVSENNYAERRYSKRRYWDAIPNEALPDFQQACTSYVKRTVYNPSSLSDDFVPLPPLLPSLPNVNAEDMEEEEDPNDDNDNQEEDEDGEDGEDGED